MTRETGSIRTSILLLALFLTSLAAAAVQPPAAPLQTVAEPEASSGGARHLYTFADGSSEAIALYQTGTPARNVVVAMPKGAEVTGAELTISGASATGWNSVTDAVRADWAGGTPTGADARGDDLTLAMADPEDWFEPHDLDGEATSASAWYDNASYAIRQPHTTNVSESRFSSQRSLASGTTATYNAAVFRYRDMLFASTWDTQQLRNTVKVLFPSNASQMTTGPNNQPLKPVLDIGNCVVPSLPSTWQAYGWRDWAVTDDERVFGLLSSYRGSNDDSYHRVIEWDIRHPLAWRCISSYDVSTGGYGDYTGIAYDRTRDSVWVNHGVRKTLVQYEFDGQGGFDRGDEFYTYFMSSGQVRGLSVHGNLFWFRTYQSWNSDLLECYAVTGDPGSTLTKQQGVATISANGYGLQYDGQRLNTLDHYSWSGGQRYREFGSGLPYLITAQPGTSIWVSEALEVDDPVVAANMETAWSTTATGDRVEYWISADNGTHWVSVTNNETVHFSHPGTQLKWKVQLVGTTAVSWWVDIEYASAYQTAGQWQSPTLPTGTQVGQMRAQWVSSTPSGTSIGIMVSNDDGQSWVWAENNIEVDWGTNVGNKLVYNVVLNSTDDGVTPVLDSLTLHYEEGYPSSVRIDIGDDGSSEYVGTGGLQDPVVVSGQALVDALNSHIPANGEGTVNITFAIKAGSPGRVRVSDLDITYRFRTRVLDASLDGGMLVPDGTDRVLVTRIAIGDDATMLTQVDVQLQHSHGADPVLRWTAGDTCSTDSDPDGIVSFDAGNCSTVTDANDVVSLRMPIQANWGWDDEVNAETNITVRDDLGLVVDGYTTEGLDLRVENDIQLLDLKAVDESGRELLPYDWMRGGTNVTFSGTIAFEGTTFSPEAGQFDLQLVGQNLTQDGEPIDSEILFLTEANPSHGSYYMTLQTPLQSSQGGMLFQIRAVQLQNGSTYINPGFNAMRIVLDGNSPLVIGATPDDGVEMHAGSQSIAIVVEDAVDPPTQITLHYWVEAQDDLNYNRLPDADEYRSSVLRSPEMLPGGINIFNGIIDDSQNSHGEVVSFYVSGEDQQNNALARGGDAVCPGMPVTCGDQGTADPDWNKDLSTYTIREEFAPVVEADNSSLLGHDDEAPLHPGTEYVARLLIGDGNGWSDIRSVHLSLIGDLEDERASIWANFSRPETGHEMHLESGSTAVAVSNLYSTSATEPLNESVLYLDIRFQLTWLFPEEFDTDGEVTFVPVVEVTDWPCDVDSDIPCHEDRGGLGYDEWSLDNDLRFDMVPGHFTATDLATGRNLYRPGDDPELIAAGQVVRVAGRILFSEDATPAPEGAFDIVIGDLERSWSAAPREGGDFTLDILVPNVRSGGLDMYARLENLPGLADDTTPQRPRIQLIVDGGPPEIRSIGPDGDIRFDQVDALPVSMHVADEHGFDSDRPAEVHWRIRAGTSEISRGNQPFEYGAPVGADWGWEGIVDLTDDGSIELLPGYIVDVWVTGSDSAGNPYLAENNSENNPLVQWRLIRVGPEVDLRGPNTNISWADPSPVGGETAILRVNGRNPSVHSGDVTFFLLEEVGSEDWVEVHGVSSLLQIDGESGWLTEIEFETEPVESREVRRYQLVARDGHVDIDWVTIEPLDVRPHTARDGEALNQQIEDSTGLFVLYIIAVASLCFGVAMLVLYRREKLAEPEVDHDQADLVDSASAQVAPPPGFEDMPPPAAAPMPSPATEAAPVPEPAPAPAPTPAPAPAPAAAATPPGPQVPAQTGYSDADLLAGGWSQEQIDYARKTGQI